MNKTIVVGISGASGVIYGIRLVKALVERPVDVHLIISDAGRKILFHEADYDGGSFEAFLESRNAVFHEKSSLIIHKPFDFFTPPASGSFRHDGMVIAPCSMKTLGNIAAGTAESLMGRAADVSLKERRPLILLPRETPLSRIHLKNMLEAASAGAVIMPPSPGFYNRPETVTELVDSIVARILDHLGLSQDIVPQWGL